MHRSPTHSWKDLVLGLALIGALLIGVIGTTNANNGALPAASTVVAARDVLVQGSPDNANGQVLQLVRYDIPAGVVLAKHTHPGMQAAYIESGVLTYHVISGGSIPITRAAHDGTPEATEMIGPGETTELYPGDSAVEIDGVVHYGENLGPDTVIILAATLLDPNQPPAVVATIEISPVASPAA